MKKAISTLMMAMMLMVGTVATTAPAQATTITFVSSGSGCGDYCTVSWQDPLMHWEGEYGPPPQYWDCTTGSWGAFIPGDLYDVVVWLAGMFGYHVDCLS